MDYINGKPIEHFYLEKDGITWTEKSPLMKLEDGLITKEEYNNYIIDIRQGQYQSNLDGKRAELLESVLSNLASQNLLTEEQKLQLESLQTKRQEIKTQHPKQN